MKYDKALFSVKVNSAGFGDVLRQWFEIFIIGCKLRLFYFHYIGSITLSETHKENKKNIFKDHAFFKQFIKEDLLDINDYKKINLDIHAINPDIGLSSKDIKRYRDNIKYNEKIIYILSYPSIYNIKNNIYLESVPITFLNYLKPNPEDINLIMHIRRGDTSFLPISKNKLMVSSGKIYENLAQILTNEKTIRERYIPIKIYKNNLIDLIYNLESQGKKIKKIYICSDGYSIFKKHHDLIKQIIPEYPENNDLLKKINTFELIKLNSIINIAKTYNINYHLFPNEEKADIEEMINICKDCNYLFYGKSCFFQNILKYLYNQNNYTINKIIPPYYYYMKKNKSCIEPRKYSGKYLIDLFTSI